MCTRVQCKQCDRPTYSGCGQHVDQVLGDVAPADRCQGHAKAPREPRDGEGSFFSRLLGR